MIFILFPTTCTASLYCKLSLSDQDMKARLYFKSVQFVVNPWFPAVILKYVKSIIIKWIIILIPIDGTLITYLKKSNNE